MGIFERRKGFAVSPPPQYTAASKWPVILFLHGAGERGVDGIAQTTVGIGPALRKREAPLPAIVVLPQCPRDHQWTTACVSAMKALEQIEGEFSVDSDRVSLTGISMGGAGAWKLAFDYPTRFSALAPVCGWVGSKVVPALRTLIDIPIWVFHGDADDIVPVEASRGPVATLEAAGGYVRYTEYPGVGHNSWDRAYQQTELLDWLIAQKRGEAGKRED